MNNNGAIIYFADNWWSGDYDFIASEIDITKLSDFQIKELLKNISNLEVLREFRDKIGLEKYLTLMNMTLIHEEIDACGYPMKLYKIDEIGINSIVLQVTCPSTKRIYHLYPPNQSAKTCSKAKESTFSRKIKYRHGDVGLSMKNDQNNLEIET